MAKVESVAGQINLVGDYIPSVQTNLVFGMDSDVGPAPFDLTKRFLDLAPGAFPTYMMLTSFGNSAPMTREYQSEGRIVDVPFSFLDGNSGLNIRLKNYSCLEFYDYMSDLARDSFSPRRIWRRFKANKRPLPRWINLLRATLSGKGARGNYLEIRNRVATDPEFQAFYSGESVRPPTFYHKKIKESLGAFYNHLPPRALNYLRHGEPAPNPRISNACSA